MIERKRGVLLPTLKSTNRSFKKLRDSPLSAKLRSRSAPEVTAHWTSLVVAVVSLLGFDFAKFLSETILER
ncbi:MAG: hypothetical protein DMG14_29710 [Acidobacteria bacterium]|nr:MAG: hypothetical protein DMG14_29710 [Acidobacteriota bacterium]